MAIMHHVETTVDPNTNQDMYINIHYCIALLYSITLSFTEQAFFQLLPYYHLLNKEQGQGTE
jgi:hypothetical protein